MQKNQQHKDTSSDLSNLRVIGVLTGLELFGNERDNIETYIALREQGAKVLVGISKNQVDSNVEKYLENLGFETFNIPFGNQWSWMWLKLYPLSIFEKLNQLWNCSRLLLNQIKIFQPTHIQINSFMGYNYVMPALFLANVPVIYRMVDGVPDDSFYNLQIWRLATKQSSKVVVISKFVEQQVLSQDVPLSKVKKLYSLAPSRTRSIQPFIQNTELNGLVYVGQVTEHKGLWQLLYAFNEIQEYGFELIIIGSSRYDINFRQQLENWVASQNLQNKVRFLGQVDDPTEFYAKSLIHIAPSIKEEPLGMVVLEAKKVGTPSIVFPSGGLPEMVRHGIDGYICRDKTPEALVEAIEWMLSDRDRLLRMGEAARDDYESRFGRERFLQELADIYLQTLKN
jgi:glycosyltransferase involved in cell wall biosynthesis